GFGLWLEGQPQSQQELRVGLFGVPSGSLCAFLPDVAGPSTSIETLKRTRTIFGLQRLQRVHDFREARVQVRCSNAPQRVAACELRDVRWNFEIRVSDR